MHYRQIDDPETLRRTIREVNGRIAIAITACFLIALATAAFILRERYVLGEARSEMAEKHFSEANKLADSAAIPPFANEADQVRSAIREAEVQEQKSQAARADYEKINKALAAIASDISSFQTHASDYDRDNTAATEASQKRVSNVESGEYSLEVNLEEAKLEESKVQAMQPEIAAMISTYRDINEQLLPFFSHDETRRLSDLIDTSSTDLLNSNSSWLEAIEPLVQSDSMEENGGGFSAVNSETMQQFYAQSTAAANAASTSLSSATSEIRRLRQTLFDRANKDKSQIDS